MKTYCSSEKGRYRLSDFERSLDSQGPQLFQLTISNLAEEFSGSLFD